MNSHDVIRTFLLWRFLRGVFHRGYVLTSGLYFVVDAHLSASQLVFLGAVVSATLALSDIPTGVWSDTIGRKRPLVIGHLLLAAGMTITGIVSTFPLVVVTQVLWGLGWAFLSGADVAWVTDELRRSRQIARVLTASDRWDLAGGATGIVAFGALSWSISLTMAIVVSGVGMGLLGLFVAARFVERNFIPTRERRWNASLATFRLGLAVSRRDPEILLILLATMLINGAAVVGWLFPKQLVTLGFPSNPVLWYTALGILSSVVGVIALRIVEARIDGESVARHAYILACGVGALGLIVLAEAPDALVGGAGVLLASGISFTVTRTVSMIWVNQHVTSDVRATMLSFLSQAESVGEIVGGFALAALAQATDISVVLIGAGAIAAFTGAMVFWRSANPARSSMRFD